MTWRGPRLDADQRQIAELIGSFVQRHDTDLEDAHPDEVAALRRELAELGVWTMGTSAAHGGGDARQEVVLVAVEQLARHWPAIAWAMVQAHVAADALAGVDQLADVIAALHAGTGAVAVVDGAAAHVRLMWRGDSLLGSIDRVDAAARTPDVLVLTSDSSAVFLAECGGFLPLRRTGLAGASTRTVQVHARAGTTAIELGGLDVEALRARLQLGGATVAAGIAGAAVDQALAYSAGRVQFGGPLTMLPTVRQSLQVQASRTSVLLTAALSAPADSAAGVLRESCDSAIEVCARALQSHGGYGYLQEYPAERFLRDAVSLRAAVDAFGASAAGARALVGMAPAAALVRADSS